MISRRFLINDLNLIINIQQPIPSLNQPLNPTNHPQTYTFCILFRQLFSPLPFCLTNSSAPSLRPKWTNLSLGSVTLLTYFLYLFLTSFLLKNSETCKSLCQHWYSFDSKLTTFSITSISNFLTYL